MHTHRKVGRGKERRGEGSRSIINSLQEQKKWGAGSEKRKAFKKETIFENWENKKIQSLCEGELLYLLCLQYY